MNFTNKIVIVTGAAQGIGYSIALTYASEGATVIIADQNEEIGKTVESTICKNGGIAMFVTTDVSKPSDIEGLVNAVASKFGKIDILINNAGVSQFVPVYEMTVDQWDEILNTNLRGTFLCSREVAKIMKRNGGGSIVNIASSRAFMSEPNSEAYAASKGGIIALTHALAASLAPDHIQVNSISPGWIQTTDYELLRPTDHHQHFAGRVGKPDDIARACLYLTAEGNNFITGTNIVIDGGMTHKMIYEE